MDLGGSPMMQEGVGGGEEKGGGEGTGRVGSNKKKRGEGEGGGTPLGEAAVRPGTKGFTSEQRLSHQ